MADEKEKNSLEMRLTRLENAIGKLVESRKAPGISEEEMKTYMKVRDALIICYCICSRCYPYRCINECTCGPCSNCSVGGGGGVFSELGV